MGTIKLSLRTDKLIKKTGNYPVELQYLISGKRKYFNTGQKLFEDNWDAKEQKAVFIKKGKLLSREVDTVNDKLTGLCSNIRRIERMFDDRKLHYTPDDIINELASIERPEKNNRDSSIFGFIDNYITEHATTRVKGSLSVYKSLRSHLSKFNSRATFNQVDHQFFQKFQNFLVDKQRLTNITAAKQLSTLKTFLNYAKLNGIEVSDKYKNFKIKQEKLEVIALTENEFLALWNLDLSTNKALDQVRDVFCFSCATGFRYSDLKQLRRENIKDDEIRITVKKTKDPLSVPLNTYSAAILDKYKDLRLPLPVISNQKMNEHLKKLGAAAKINEPVEIVRYRGTEREAIVYPKFELIGCHTGRKTFCTLSLERGMSAEEVMSISGHTDYKSFKRYIKVTEQRKKVVMVKAWGGKGNLKAV